MSWPIPIFPKIECPKPISLRIWLPTLAVIAGGAAGVVLMLWPHGKSTQTFQFWATLVGAPLIACALTFGVRLDQWEDEQTDAEEAEKEQKRLGGMWREWTRRHLSVVDSVAFPAVTDDMARFTNPKTDIPVNSGRCVTFDWVKGRAITFRRTRLLHLVARRFADTLQTRREVIVTLFLDDISPGNAADWTQRVKRVFGLVAPRTIFQVDVQPAKKSVEWIEGQVDLVDTATRLIIAAQLWTDEEKEHKFSEGAAAFLITPDAPHAGSIFRPMTSTRDTLDAGLNQIKAVQASPALLRHAWFACCEQNESIAIRFALTEDPKNSAVEHLLDKSLGLPGPASGWMALAIAMEAMRGAGPQLIAWHEGASDPLHLCMISPLPKKETTV
ncbi:hypothetical protein [Paraburkholderia caballeronis]|uniref:hypothetical protein n=1 Tax=Paraburkholderia caballeronis TaxID=416943 RepID=UPI00106703E6|nr:hypothetical protein [Paraburkholderia caballeronis]TDV04568.1 hypothetical protein C7408_1339 [Paraburkholderia caballeronis]TDV07710.1 hypothetical protein C7406_1359 [Paraburkholderia caballeronis]TDV17741.1 hypothetical protein C7404_1359 [Paraburkholderia caballeronis]